MLKTNSSLSSETRENCLIYLFNNERENMKK